MAKQTVKLTTSEYELIDYFMRLPTFRTKYWLDLYKVEMVGPKAELREQIVSGIERGKLTTDQLKDAVDAETLAGRHHVFLFKGPPGDISSFTTKSALKSLLKSNKIDGLLDAEIPMDLSAKLSLVRVEWEDSTLRILAAQRREYDERDAKLDREGTNADGDEVEYRAYVRRVDRGLVALDWDVAANTAHLSIAQLPGSGGAKDRYVAMREEFAKLLTPWLHLSAFPIIALDEAIKRLERAAKTGKCEAAVDGVSYETPGNRVVAFKSPIKGTTVHGEAVTDKALKDVGDKGKGRLANCEWHRKGKSSHDKCSLALEVSTELVAQHSRVAFPKYTGVAETNYVLRRIRHYC